MALYQGAFWIAGNSVKDILSGNYKLICNKIKSDNIGNMLEKKSPKEASAINACGTKCINAK